VCTCNAGTFGPDWGRTCELCAFGTYKLVPGSVMCTACTDGKFSGVEGSDANVCTCDAGTTGMDGTSGVHRVTLENTKQHLDLPRAPCVSQESFRKW